MVLIAPIYRFLGKVGGRARRGSTRRAKGVASYLFLLGAGAMLSAAGGPAQAVDFSLNFQPGQPPGWSGNVKTGVCAFAASDCATNNLGNGDPTPFSETLQNIGGQTYFHTIVGDPATGFAIESYTRWGAGPNATNATNPTDLNIGDFSPDSGGNARSVIGNPSTPTTVCSTNPDQCTNGVPNGTTAQPSPTFMDVKTNLGNPLAGPGVSGSGTGDPTKTVFRMVMTSAKGDMSMEVVKPYLTKKPRVSETIQSGSMASSFTADMTAISYSDKNTPAKITNNLTLSGVGLPAGSGANFDMSLAQHPDVTAGRFTYTPGNGWDTSSGWDSTNSVFDPGTYNYQGGSGFDPLTVDWASNFHYNENALSCTRPNSGGLTRDTSLGNPTGGSCPGHP